MAAETLESDIELAFHLQLQEALTASLALQPSSSSTQAPRNDAVRTIPTAPAVVSYKPEELVRVEQELRDRVQSEIEMRRATEDLIRRLHDEKVAREIMKIPDDEWQESGGDFAKPFDEGSSSSAASMESEESMFRLYFKGLVSEEQVGDQKLVLAGIGIAICDPSDNLVFEVRKPLIGNGLSRNSAQLKALIEGLTAALSLGLKRITFFCDNHPIFQFVNGKWSAKQRKVLNLVNQVNSLQSKFTQCNSRLVARFKIKFAFQLARDAIESQSQTKPSEPTASKTVKETCVICMEDSDVSQMFSVDGCLHRYCFSCMKKHVEVQLLHGIIPRCPHVGCKSDLSVDSCVKFLTPKHVDTMRQRIKEASIPATERVYCPYPRCSLLMSKSEVLEHAKETLMGAVEQSGLRRCMKCEYLFCINCKVPWHRNSTCADYKRLNPNPPEEDTKLKFLASCKLWRQCVKCNHMIELLEGCYHMVCRCNYEFCYNCGAEWKDKKPTCKCPLWNEENILHEDDEDDDFDEEESDSDSDDYLSGNDVCYYCGAEWKDKKATCSCPISDEDNSLDDEDDRYIEEDEDDDDEDYSDDDYQSEDEEENEVEGQEYENEDDEYESGSVVGEEEVQGGQIQEQVLEKDIENHILSDEVDYSGEEEEEEEEEDDDDEEDFDNDEYQSEDEEENEVGGYEYENEDVVGKDEVQEGQIKRMFWRKRRNIISRLMKMIHIMTKNMRKMKRTTMTSSAATLTQIFSCILGLIIIW